MVAILPTSSLLQPPQIMLFLKMCNAPHYYIPLIRDMRVRFYVMNIAVVNYHFSGLSHILLGYYYINCTVDCFCIRGLKYIIGLKWRLQGGRGLVPSLLMRQFRKCINFHFFLLQKSGGLERKFHIWAFRACNPKMGIVWAKMMIWKCLRARRKHIGKTI